MKVNRSMNRYRITLDRSISGSIESVESFELPTHNELVVTTNRQPP